ncbi:MAG: DUF1573 domain-containing protein [Prevotellaceae bacterium]|nr:DUF1573 domain-containing protein [Prevotellaceae bacterium]
MKQLCLTNTRENENAHLFTRQLVYSFTHLRMKKMFLLALVCLFNLAVNAQTADSTVVFKSTTHDFGEIQQGVPQTFSFEFVNNGTEPIVIQNVKPSCGCTTPGWTKEPVEPGKSGYVQATYNAAAVGPFSKSLTVTYSGGSKSITLQIKGTVKEAEK